MGNRKREKLSLRWLDSVKKDFSVINRGNWKTLLQIGPDGKNYLGQPWHVTGCSALNEEVQKILNALVKKGLLYSN